MAYDVGDVWTPQLTARDANGTLTNATVALLITDPSAAATSPSVSNPSTGIYTSTVLLDEAGAWTAKWTVSGAVTGVELQWAYVRRLGSNIVSVNEVKDRLDKSLQRTVDDDEIEDMIVAAVAEYETYVGPVSGTITENHNGGATTLILNHPNVVSVVSATYADGTTIDVDDLDLDTTTGIVHWGYNTSGAFTRGVRNVTITYSVGAVPANHREAIIADVAGYFSATQRGASPLAEDGYAQTWSVNPMVLFPRIRALAGPSIA